MNIEIANRLVQLRKQHGFSQEELAARIGISRQAVSKWERAEASPDTDNLITLSRLYGVSLDEILRTDDPVEAFARGGEETAEDWAWEEDEGHTPWQRFPYPVLCTIIFLVLGFAFDLWHPAWVIFVTIPIYYALAWGDLRRAFPYAVVCGIVYVCLGILFDLWHPGWLIFLTIPLWEWLKKELNRKKKEEP